MKICYLCQIEDPNETPFDPDQHGMCLICVRKMEVLADNSQIEGVGFVRWSNPYQGRSYVLSSVDEDPPEFGSEEWLDVMAGGICALAKRK